MKDKIPVIREELERRLEKCKKIGFDGFLIFAYDYIDYVEHLLFIKKIIEKEEEDFFIKHSKGDFSKEDFSEDSLNYRKIFSVVYSNFRDEVTDKRKELTKKNLLNFKKRLFFIHYQILLRLSELEIIDDNKKEEEPIHTHKSVKDLGITPDSKWEDIQISLKEVFKALVKYKELEVEVDIDDMGFADKRKKGKELVKTNSWDFLHTLSMSDGVLELTVLKSEEKLKIKKLKQETSKLLRKFFHIKEDPFFKVDSYKPEYKVKFKLRPSSDFRDDYHDWDIDEEDGDYFSEY